MIILFRVENFSFETRDLTWVKCVSTVKTHTYGTSWFLVSTSTGEKFDSIQALVEGIRRYPFTNLASMEKTDIKTPVDHRS